MVSSSEWRVRGEEGGESSSNLLGKLGKFSKEKWAISKKKGPKFDFLADLLIKLAEI